MKKLIIHGRKILMSMLLVVFCFTMTATVSSASSTATPASSSASVETGMQKVVEPVVELINSMLVPAMMIVGAIGTLYCVLLGVKFAKAEEQQEREKAKQHLKNAIIGFVLIFVLIVVLNLAMDPLADWVKSSADVNLK